MSRQLTGFKAGLEDISSEIPVMRQKLDEFNMGYVQLWDALDKKMNFHKDTFNAIYENAQTHLDPNYKPKSHTGTHYPIDPYKRYWDRE